MTDTANSILPEMLSNCLYETKLNFLSSSNSDN